ncbi:MAG TPA: PD-(D/E)XK nuclease family protein [Pyrinomonadaceae bacterium]|nr:PD-(D/E)XK nuclease family protein [Pyrinomonadaceae bacterium]
METNVNLTFDEASHTYHADGVEMLSVSALLGLFTKQSLKNTTNERIKEKARVNSEIAIEKGKAFHEIAAKVFQFVFFGSEVKNEGATEKMISCFMDTLTFIRKAGEILDTGIETALCSPTFGVAGTPDLVIHYADHRTKIIDWKTNASLDPNNFGKSMEPPLDTLPDTSMAYYIMQLNLYAWLVSQNADVPIENISAHIVHVSGPHAPVIYQNCITPEKQALVAKLLEWKKLNENFIKKINT